MDADGANFRKLQDNVPYNMHTGTNAVWSPDGRHVYWGETGACDLDGNIVERPPDDKFVRNRNEYRKGPIHITNEMCYALSPHKQLLDAQPAAVRNPKWSPDRPYMDYLLLIHLDDGRIEKLAKTPRTHPRSHHWTHPNPSWSPDGSMVMYDSDEAGVCQVYIVIVDEEKVRARFGRGAIAAEM
jgi:hypothetical protein